MCGGDEILAARLMGVEMRSRGSGRWGWDQGARPLGIRGGVIVKAPRLEGAGGRFIVKSSHLSPWLLDLDLAFLICIP
jgi:hypothetical protein